MTTNAVVEIVNAVVVKLRTNATVKSLVSTRVHKALPASPTYPCVSVFVPVAAPWDTKDAQGMEPTVQVDCWTRDDRDQDSVRTLQAAIKNALHEQSLSLASESHVLTREISAFAFDDPDGTTVHGVSSFRVLAHA